MLWYDALTADTGELRWQSALNERNAPFFDATDGIFVKAKLDRSTFFRAQLVRADFENTNLKDANMARSQLSGANFRGAKLSGANFLAQANCPPNH